MDLDFKKKEYNKRMNNSLSYQIRLHPPIFFRSF